MINLYLVLYEETHKEKFFLLMKASFLLYFPFGFCGFFPFFFTLFFFFLPFVNKDDVNDFGGLWCGFFSLYAD